MTDLLPNPGWFIRTDGEDGSETIHGVAHVLRVGVHARELANALRLPQWEREALRLAALWHDIGRTCDGRDDFHGAKSAGKVVGLGLHRGVDARTLAVALFAVTFHSAPDSVGEDAEDDPDTTSACSGCSRTPTGSTGSVSASTSWTCGSSATPRRASVSTARGSCWGRRVRPTVRLIPVHPDEE